MGVFIGVDVGVDVGVGVGVMVGVTVSVIVGVGVFVGLKFHLLGIQVGKIIVGPGGMVGLGGLKRRNADASCGLTESRIVPNNIKIIFFIILYKYILVFLREENNPLLRLYA
ncbi:hypothetical protein KKD61_04000 [Patescibacteria group bacterium]|nr:hypothetical protein [Patescibacteria group bacterium]